MIIIFILLWFSMLWGMEIDQSKVQPSNVILPVPSLKELSRIPSLETITQRAVCSHIINKKITINDVRQFPPHKQDLIHSVITSEPKEVKSGEFYHLSTITPDHRYMLGADNKNQNILRLDLYTNETIIVDDSKENNLEIALSPSGNLVALASSQKIWIKDIAQKNKIIIEKSIEDALDNFIGNFMGKVYGVLSDKIPSLSFLGEKRLLFKDSYNAACLSVEKLEKHSPDLTDKYMEILPITEEYIIYNDDTYLSDDEKGTFLRTTLEGTIKSQTKVKNLVDFTDVKPALYEPEMLIAYKNAENKEYIDIVSLKDWPAVAKSSARLRCSKDKVIRALAFAQRGQWLIVAVSDWGKDNDEYGKIRIWDWQHKQQLYTYKSKDLIYRISSTDCCTPYPCLFESNNPIYSFDPVKAVAASMLFQATPQQTAATFNDNNSNNNNNNNNNNNVSNDNGPAPKKAKKTTKKDSGERRHKRPKK